MNCVGHILNVQYLGVDALTDESEREFLEWYEGQKDVVFDNKQVLEKYYQDDVTALRQAHHIFRRDFIQIGT